jgi:DNA-binding NarL/FixJ family response regulator
VRSVGDGDALLDPTITRRLIERYARPRRLHAGAAGKLSELTPREREVLTGLRGSRYCCR